MKKVKMFICMAMAAALLSHTTTAVWAAVTHVEGCNNKTYTYAECGNYVSTAVVDGHTIRDVNGNTIVCQITAELRFHNMLCANSSCRVLMESNVVDECTRWHSGGCATEYGVCKQ